MGTLFIVLLLLSVSGFIAYSGDLLGRRFGKKRLSLFGLRPKHTAIVLTVATGVLIAALTFAAALVTFPWFRSVVTQGERLALQNQRLRVENERQSAANRNLAAQNEGLAAENARLAEANRRLDTRNAALLATNRRLSRESAALKRRNDGLQRASAALRAANAALQTQNRRLEGASRELAADARALRLEQRRLGDELRRQQSELVRLRDLATRYREEQYVFRRNAELGRRRYLLPDTPRELLREVVRTLMFDAERTAREKGLVVRYVPPVGYPPERPADAASIREWFVQRLFETRQHPLVVRALVDENCVAGRPVPVRLDSFVNTLVFTKGQIITSRYVDGADPEGLVFADLMLFLTSQVRSVATDEEHQMVPSEEGLGEASWAQLLGALREIKRIGGLTVLRARAATDIRRAGPLNLELEVVRLEDALRAQTR